MKIIFNLIIIFFLATTTLARQIGETEITTEDGIEVYQNEKFYLLKKNVTIESDNFTLNADKVKINFNENMYDIIELDAEGSVVFNSSQYNTNGSGENLNFKVQFEQIEIEGINSVLLTDDIKMFSDGIIKVNNSNGKFSLMGPNSKLFNENILIEAQFIDGVFSNEKGKKEIIFLDVLDENMSYVKNNDTEMYAKNINFNNKTSLIELIDEVTIIRNGEHITGDYGILNTKDDSYKIKSNKKTKVKAIIQNNE